MSGSGGGEVRSTKGVLSGPWNKEKPVQSIRVPRDLQDAALQARSNPPPQLQPQPQPSSSFADVVRHSTLNVNAQEFVPQWAQAPTAPSQEDRVYLTEAIEILTLDPGRYLEFLAPIGDIAESLLEDSRGLAVIVDIIIDQCIREANFRYTGARICQDLSRKFGIGFINCLLNRCCEKNSIMSRTMERDRGQVLGFALLLAELFRQITVGDDSRIDVLARALGDLLNMLLSKPAVDTIKTICQILKLCGVELELSGIALEPIFICLEELKGAPALDSVRPVINSVLQIRRSDWRPSAYSADPLPVGHAQVFSEPVFYGPDGQVISEEESSFLRDNIPVSEDLDDYELDPEMMNDEVCEAYDEFLNSFPQNNRYHRP